ncbi:MAG: hypothetical protein ACE5RO_05280, partial [Candidatus Nitrosomaritimum yanchengensis]
KHTQGTIVIPPTRQKQSFELTTLTRLSRKEQKFPLFEKQVRPKEDLVEKELPVPEVTKQKEDSVNETIQPNQKVENKIEITQSIVPKPDLTREVAKITQHKALPEPQKKSSSTILDDDFDDDSDDLDKIKGEIMNVLSKLDQAEVE